MEEMRLRNSSAVVRQIVKLLKIQLLQYMDINEALHSKDKKKRHSLYFLLGTYIFLGAIIAIYMSGGAYGLCFLGLPQIVPAYLLSITSILILVFTILKAGSMLFQIKNYEMLISLPISPMAIVVSRFLNMYAGSLVLAVLAMLPAGIIYGVFVNASAAFYIIYVISIFLVPLVPLTTASVIGAAVTAVAARMKHKNALTIVTSMALIIGVLSLSFYPAFQAGEITEQQMTDFTSLLSSQINNLYPLANLYTEAIVTGSPASFAGFAAVSVGIFAVFAGVVQWKYASICAALITHAARKNYVLGKQHRRSPIGAMYIKEMKRYFSSSIYVMNTAIGYIMMLLLGVAFLFVGRDKVMNAMEVAEAARDMAEKILPFILALMGMLGTTTISALSMEGKQWWIPKSLPVSTKVILDSKILVNLTLAVPSCAIAAVLCVAALGYQGMSSVWMLVIPLMYCVLASVMGMAINIKFPQFHWDNETSAVKQGTAILAGMVLEFIVVIAGVVPVFFVSGAAYHVLMGIIAIALLLMATVIYKKIVNFDLRKLD